jgi:hypothetical protein
LFSHLNYIQYANQKQEIFLLGLANSKTQSYNPDVGWKH